jgi:hypothetical protein
MSETPNGTMRAKPIVGEGSVHNPIVQECLEISPSAIEKVASKDSIFNYLYRTNLFLLFMCFALVMTCSTLLISTVPLAAEEIGISKEFATLTIGLYLFGAAVSASLSGRLFSKFGRFMG